LASSVARHLDPRTERLSLGHQMQVL